MSASKSDITTVYPPAPCVAVGAVVFHNDGVLLVKRAKPPARALWAIPGGSVQLGESLQQAAEREILEETGIVIRAKDPVYTFDMIERDDHGRIRFHYVIIDLAADYVSGELAAGDDATAALWVDAAMLKALPVNPATRRLLHCCYAFGEQPTLTAATGRHE